MPEGPLGGSRPLVKTHLKYDVAVHMQKEIYRHPPKAKDVLDVRVNSVQSDVVEKVQDDIGRAILAVNRLAHPSRARMVNEDYEESEDTKVTGGDNVKVTWTYIIKDHGLGEYADTATNSEAMWKLHEVLVKENDEPIERSTAIREFDPGPLSVNGVNISTD